MISFFLFSLKISFKIKKKNEKHKPHRVSHSPIKTFGNFPLVYPSFTAFHPLLSFISIQHRCIPAAMKLLAKSFAKKAPSACKFCIRNATAIRSMVFLQLVLKTPALTKQSKQTVSRFVFEY